MGNSWSLPISAFELSVGPLAQKCILPSTSTHVEQLRLLRASELLLTAAQLQDVREIRLHKRTERAEISSMSFFVCQ